MNTIDAKHPLRIILKRLCFFFLVLYVSSLALWIAGNKGDFLDSTQIMLIRVLTYDAIALAFFSIAGLVCVVVLPSGRPRGNSGFITAAAGLAGYLLMFTIAIAGLVFGEALTVAASGLG